MVTIRACLGQEGCPAPGPPGTASGLPVGALARVSDPPHIIVPVTRTGGGGGLSPEVREVLRAYLDASLLSDSLQADLWREAHLTLAQLAVLRNLRDGRPRLAGELAGAVGLSPASATRLFDRLEERGLLRRHRGRDDRRCVEIRLTARGRRLVGPSRALRNSPLRRAVEAMTEAEQRTLAAGLRRLAEQARRLERLSPRVALP